MTMPQATGAPRRRDFPAWIYITSFLLIVLLGILPILTTVVGVAMANAYGCQVDESSVHPCLINGADQGELLQSLGNSFWFTLYTLPLAFLLFHVRLVVIIVHLVIAGRRRKAALA
jgi:hypothetical protein